MEFVDNVTPQNPGDYIDDVRNYYQKSSDRTRQLSGDWATMYYQNAYNTALLNYMNEYNSPAQQMLRYQQAGISPLMVAQNGSPGNMDSGHAGAAPKGAFVAPSSVQKWQAGLQTINSIQQAIGAASELYNFVRFGVPSAEKSLDILDSKLLQERALASKYSSEADWQLYWNYGPGMGPNSPLVEGSPRAAYMEQSTNRIAAQISQLDALVDVIYPNQAEAYKARAALDDYRKQVLEGQYSAPLMIDTGNGVADAILQAFIFKLMNTNLNVGFMGKMF